MRLVIRMTSFSRTSFVTRTTLLARIGGVPLQFVSQNASADRHGDVAAQNVMTRHVWSIHRSVATIIGMNDGAVQASSRKNALGAGIGKDFGTELQVGTGGSLASDWAGCDGNVAAHFELVAEQ